MKSKQIKRKSDRIESLIGKSMRVEGDVKFSGGLLVEGKVKGNVSSAGGGTLTLTESSSVEGDVSAARIVLNGSITGDVHATEHVMLKENAVVNGVVYYDLLEMAVGATVNGNLVHKPNQSGRRAHTTPVSGQSSKDSKPAE